MAAAVTVPVDSLALNQRLEFPVYSCDGTLLLAAGHTFNAGFLDRLRDRGIQYVLLNAADAQRLAGNDTAKADDDQQLRALEAALNERIDEFIRKNALRIRNTGPAVAGQVVQHGAKRYDAEQQAAAQAATEQSLAAVESVLDSVAAGGEVDLHLMNQGMDASINSLVADFASTLSVTFSSSGNSSLADHAVKMATLGMAIGIEMGFDSENVRLIGIAGMLGDLGMARVPQHILNAKRRLTPGEFVDVQKHAILTANALERMHWLPGILSIIAYQIHEKPDGSGYPKGRTMKSIHPMARILHAADTYAALTSPRPDRPRMQGYAAMELLLKQAQQKKQDPDVVRALVRCMGMCPIGSYVVLSDQSVATVLRINPDHPVQPVVLRIVDAKGQQIADGDADAVIDLRDSYLSIVKAIPGPHSRETSHDCRAAWTDALWS